MRRALLSALIAVPAVLHAQNAPFELNTVYECRPPLSLKILSCAGSNNPNDVCDVQSYNAGKPFQRGPSTRAQVALVMTICHKQTEAEAKAEASGAVAPAPIGQPSAATGVGPGGLKVGDRVRVLITGWSTGRVLRIQGNSFYVHLDNGLDVQKQWPFEVFREGTLTAADHAAGQYDTHDRVQVRVNGKWVEGEIVGQQYNNYSIKVPGYTFDFGSDIATTTPENIRMSTTPPPPSPARRAAGQAPKAGLVSCAGKYEGRWEYTAGFGGERVVFRSGKATVGGPLGGTDEYECFTGGGQVLLYKAGSFKAEGTFEINNDGTLQGEFGAFKKMGN